MSAMNDVSALVLSDDNLRHLADQAMQGFGDSRYVSAIMIRNWLETEITAALQKFPPTFERPVDPVFWDEYVRSVHIHVNVINEMVLRVLTTRVTMNALEFDWQIHNIVAGAQPIVANQTSVHVVPPQIELRLAKRLMGPAHKDCDGKLVFNGDLSCSSCSRE